MAYTAWSVVFGEQPTAAKWNQLGTNDAGFKDGTNIDAGAITFAKLAATIFGGEILSQANAGTAGGTMYYINLGGLKLLFAISDSKNATTAAPQYTFTLPVSFFSTIKAVQTTAGDLTSSAVQYNNAASTSTSSISVSCITDSGTRTQKIHLLVVGT